jgi:septal ring-binding cell division protein DamX
VSDEKQKKKNDNETGDPFWSRILIFTVIVIWVALMAGNWVGHYMIKSGILGKKTSAYGSEFKEAPSIKPKSWKRPTNPTPKSLQEKVLGITSTPDPKKVKEDEAKKLLDSAKPSPGAATESVEAEPSPSPTVESSPKPEPSPGSTEAAAPTPSPKTAVSASPAPQALLTPKKEQTAQVKSSPKPSTETAAQATPAARDTQTPRTAADSSSSTSGNFSIQIGNFERNDYAVELVDRLKTSGYNPVIVRTGDRYKVFMGSYDNRDKAKETSDRLKSDGFDSFVVGE